jgi:resuscitation-promoting factor RpfA
MNCLAGRGPSLLRPHIAKARGGQRAPAHAVLVPMAESILTAVERGDVDELIRLVDGLCASREWDRLVELRDRCAHAIERGRQLWPVAAHAEYRLALEAPGRWAAAVLVEGAGRFAPGPLPEVAASTHEWADLAPHVPPGPPAVLAAHERVVRGEDLTAEPLPGPPVLDLPLTLAGWEPEYCLAHYRADGADFPGPPPPTLDSVDDPPRAPAGSRDPATDALLDAVRAWTEGSEGHAEAVAVHGDALVAIAALGRDRVRVAEVSPAAALSRLAWAGASGGAHARRPGAAAGRFAAWWAGAALTGLVDDWPLDADALGDALTQLRWYVWDGGGATTGWRLHLAIEDPSAKQAWAVAAVDVA